MKHVFFALFDNEKDMTHAMAEVRAANIGDEHLSVITHQATLDKVHMPPPESDAREGLVGGGLTGAVAGALTAGIIAGPFGLLGIGALAAALFGAAAGGAIGALGGALSGAGFADRTLEQWSQELKHGKVILTVSVDDSDIERDIEAIFARHGARETRKHMM